MKLSLNWIKEYIEGVDFSKISIKELNDRVTLSIAEVEEIVKFGSEVNNVVVGEITSITTHPNSEKLSIVKVNIGSETIQSVCGAKNIHVGMIVPFAKLGGSIVNHPEIKATNLDGVDSFGVLCSASEIGISDDHSGVLELDKTFTIGKDIKSILPIDDIVIDIDNKSLTNRPDLWGHYGFAREIAAVFGGSLKSLPISIIPKGKGKIDIKVVDTEKCNRYSALRMSNISSFATDWTMQVRLYYCGMRSISLLVDLTNYVMLDLGQPLHAFDGKCMDKVVIKSPEAPMSFVTLDGVTRNIDTNTLMIYNGDIPVAIAGIMGGQDSEIKNNSYSILLESANFSPFFTRRSAISLGLRTEASNRYEKSLDTNLTTQAIERFVYLLQCHQPNVSIDSSIEDVVVRQNKEVAITIEKDYIDKYIGLSLPKSTIIGILQSLCFDVREANDVFEITVPTFRTSKDITSKVDIIEEITRVYGYDNITPKSLNIELKPLEYNSERLIEYEIKETLAAKFGLSEINSYVWYDNAFNKSIGITNIGTAKVKNPQTVDSDTLRDTIIPSLLQAFEKNSRNFDEIGLFEIGHVFTLPQDSGLIKENKELGIVLASKKDSVDALFARLKGIAEFLVKSIKRTHFSFDKCPYDYVWIDKTVSNKITIDSKPIGYISSLNEKIRQCFDKKWHIVMLTFNFTQFATVPQLPISYTIPSRFPEITMDFNFLVDLSVPYIDVEKHIQAFDNPILLNYKFVEVYSGKQIEKGKKCLTFSFTIGSQNRTLTNDEKEEFSKSIIDYMGLKGFILRQ